LEHFSASSIRVHCDICHPVFRVLKINKPPDETVKLRRNPYFLGRGEGESMKKQEISKKNGLKSRLSLLLSHHPSEEIHRTIHPSLHGREIFLCARGVGRYVGLLSTILLSPFLTLSNQAYLLIFILFPLPSTLDWATQKFGLRESRNCIRVFTGFLVGVSQALLLTSLIAGLTPTSIYGLLILSVYFMIFCFSKKAGSMKEEVENERDRL